MQLLAPLDALRRDAMAAVLARPRLGVWLTRRDARLVAFAIAGVAAALATTCLLPAAALVLAPIVLGVPHVASDARYLVLRRGLPRGVVAAAALGCVAMLALRVAEFSSLPSFASLPSPPSLASCEIVVGAAWAVLLALLGGVASGRWARVAIVALAVALASVAALRDTELARLVLAHGHNLVGVGLWVLLFRRARRPIVPVAIALVLATLVAASGAPLRVAHALGTDHAFGMTATDAAAMLAPGLPVAVGMGLVASYVLLQGVHYAVWLGWIPQDDVRGEGTLTFAMTARALVRDFRPLGIAAIALAWLAVIGGALASARGARDTYLALASFHAYAELAMLAYFAVAGFTSKHPEARAR